VIFPSASSSSSHPKLVLPFGLAKCPDPYLFFPLPSFLPSFVPSFHLWLTPTLAFIAVCMGAEEEEEEAANAQLALMYVVLSTR
jgi:hypothetical protein